MCGWQEWGENWMYGVRLQEMAVYVAPLVPRGLQSEALNSNVLTHYPLEQRATENTGVRSTELVVSFTVYFWRNKLWHSTPRVAQFYLPERTPGWCVTSDMNLYLGGVHLGRYHSLLVFLLLHWTGHPGFYLWLFFCFWLLNADCSWISFESPSLNYKLGPVAVKTVYRFQWLPNIQPWSLPGIPDLYIPSAYKTTHF